MRNTTRPRTRSATRRPLVSQSPALSWDDLVQREPRLQTLLDRVERIRADADPRRPFCANFHWYGYDDGNGIVRRLCELVGWGRQPSDALATREAYDIAYRTLYDQLPDCRSCGCIDLSTIRASASRAGVSSTNA